MLIGYARVSTQDQNLELQREALDKVGCKKVFEEKVSGTRADRPGLAKTLEMLREGDTLVVWKLDRLGRSVKQLVDLVGELHKQGVQFRSLTDSIDSVLYFPFSETTPYSGRGGFAEISTATGARRRFASWQNHETAIGYCTFDIVLYSYMTHAGEKRL
jgi:hypothetical protein